jgi:hypothetical protein
MLIPIINRSNPNNNMGASFMGRIIETDLTVVGNSTTCNISSIVFLEPGDHNSTTAPSTQTTTFGSTSSTSPSTRSVTGSASASRKSEVGKFEVHFGFLFLVISTILSILC